MKLAAVILAAGYSSRMDGFKPLMRLGDHTLISHCIRLFQHIGVEVLVVVGHRGHEVTQAARGLGAEVVVNPDFAQGMFSSVRAGLARAMEMDGIFILPVDIPLVRPATVRSLHAAFDGDQVIHPVRDGLRGHPPLIPGKLIPAILQYQGSGGLKAAMERCPTTEVQVWDDGAFMDADTPEDFLRLTRRWKNREVGSREEAESVASIHMPPRGIAHGQAVARVAARLAEALQAKDISLDPDVVYNGGLLHDVAKGQADHERRGGALMRELGLSALAPVVAGHRDAQPVAPEALGEKEVVCLADKLVRGTRPVAVEERFQEKLLLYRDDPAACSAIRNRLRNALLLQQAFEQVVSRPLAAVLGREHSG